MLLVVFNGQVEMTTDRLSGAHVSLRKEKSGAPRGLRRFVDNDR